ncbi:MAG TPA: Maf family protein [Oculatellaceae cyanobacterium]
MSKSNQVSNQQQKRITGEEHARIVLASGSPRRLELLTNLGLDFEVIPSKVEESVPPGISPEELVRSLAREKAHDVLKTLSKEQNTVVIGADTMVVLDGKLIGKPTDEDDARQMLRRLSERTHTVFTGVIVLKRHKDDDLKEIEHVESSLVTFRKLDEKEITAYIATREPMDKAGGYALQGVGAALVARVEGCYTNIIGLPVPTIVSMLRQAGVNILGLPDCQDSI